MDITTALKSHRTLNRLLDEAGDSADDSLRLQVCESCKNLLRMFAGNPTATHAVRLELVNSNIQTAECQKKNAAIIEKLQSQLDAAIEDKEEETSKKNEADKQQAADIRGSGGKQQKLSTEIEQLKDQF